VTDPNGHATSYEYDANNRKTKRTLPLAMFETFVSNQYGDPKEHVDFRGKKTVFTYDTRRRLLTRVPDPSLAESTVTMTYSPTGTRATMVDASGTTTYTYDLRNRILTKATLAGTLTYTYDAAGNLATVRSSNPNGTSVNYSWDARQPRTLLRDSLARDLFPAE
jgi:YD repeat-containing protein